ncbi:MAG: TIGR02757 family protein [Gemmatimonadetes bacterium]|nr:TIGR02757 family protein [Gemmatimonadota bacterium]
MTQPENGAGPDRQMKRFLDRIYARYARPEYLGTDPLPLVRRYSDSKDREVAGVIAALAAYGRVSAICAHVEECLLLLGDRPYRTVRSFRADEVPSSFLSIRYRFHTGRDIVALLSVLASIYRTHDSLETLFRSFSGNTYDRLEGMVGEFRKTDISHIYDADGWKSSYGLNYLFTDPSKGGACKRWNLFLRWMIREDDGIDCGAWSDCDPAELQVPLDTHLHRIGRRLGFIPQKTASRAAVRSMTSSLALYDSRDPVRFDFPLCRLGILDRCPSEGFAERCAQCEMFDPCRRAVGPPA